MTGKMRSARPLETLRHAAGVLAFLATWAIVALLAIGVGDYWMWLGMLFGWIPAIIVSNVAERLWPLLMATAVALVWHYWPSS